MLPDKYAAPKQATANTVALIVPDLTVTTFRLARDSLRIAPADSNRHNSNSYRLTVSVAYLLFGELLCATARLLIHLLLNAASSFEITIFPIPSMAWSARSAAFLSAAPM